MSDDRSFVNKYLYGFIVEKYKLYKLKQNDSIFKTFDKDVQKLKDLRSLVAERYKKEFKIRAKAKALREEMQSWEEISEDLINNLANSAGSNDQLLLQLEGENEQQAQALQQKIDEFVYILKGGKEITIHDVLKTQFLIDTCLKDLELIKKRMVNPTYRDDQHFMNYFFWYNRVMKNIRSFARKIVLNTPSTESNAQTAPQQQLTGPATTKF